MSHGKWDDDAAQQLETLCAMGDGVGGPTQNNQPTHAQKTREQVNKGTVAEADKHTTVNTDTSEHSRQWNAAG
jgi:hypothetical protein